MSVFADVVLLTLLWKNEVESVVMEEGIFFCDFVLLIDVLLTESSFFQHLLIGDGYMLALYSHDIYLDFKLGLLN